MPTKVSKCHCESKFQDKEYGSKNRVYNEVTKDNTWRCTVCGKTQSSGPVAAKKSKVEKEKVEKEKA